MRWKETNTKMRSNILRPGIAHGGTLHSPSAFEERRDDTDVAHFQGVGGNFQNLRNRAGKSVGKNVQKSSTSLSHHFVEGRDDIETNEICKHPFSAEKGQVHVKGNQKKRHWHWYGYGCIAVGIFLVSFYVSHTLFKQEFGSSEEQRNTESVGSMNLAANSEAAASAGKWPSNHCQFDSQVLKHLDDQGLLTTPSSEQFKLRHRYTNNWNARDTCWLANQLLLTEALGGHHKYCNNHPQNRNLLYAFSALAGSMQPATEAVKLVGSVLKKYEFNENMQRSYQSNIIRENPKLIQEEKQRIVKELEGPGVSVLPRSMDEGWLDRLQSKLENVEFTQITEGWSIKGLNPNSAQEKGMHGSFSLHDLNSLMAIEEVQQIAYDPFILNIIQDVMGVPPIIRAVDLYMNIPKSDGSATKFSFDTWHKDFNSARSIKVFVYLTDVLDANKDGPHTYIPSTQDVAGPTFLTGNSTRMSGLGSQGLYEELVQSHALGLSSQVLPEKYLKKNVFTQKEMKLLGQKGLVWIEDTHVYHRADHAEKGWRGLLQIDFTSTGYCGKDHKGFHKPLDSIPKNEGTEIAMKDFPRLFQRMQIGDYASPRSKHAVPDYLLKKAQPLEERFGTLLYDKEIQQKNPKNHAEYVSEGFKDTPEFPTPDDQYYKDFPGAPCWEFDCLLCLKHRGYGTCSSCSTKAVCTCTCEHLFTCPIPTRASLGSSEEGPSTFTSERQELPVTIEYSPSGSNLIPLKIHQFWYSLDDIPDGSNEAYKYTFSMMNSWRTIIPGVEYHVYDDKSARQYLKENLPSVVLEAYDALVPGAFKSDLFRYAVLLLEGGIYADNDLLPEEVGIKELLKSNDTSFFISIDRKGLQDLEGKKSHCFLNGLIGASPGHPALAIALSRIVSHVLKQSKIADIGQTLCPETPVWHLLNFAPLYLTGPCLIGSSMNIALGRSPFSDFEPGTMGAYDSKFPIEGNMRFIQFDYAEIAPGFPAMRRYLVNEDGKKVTVTWSKLTGESPRSNEIHYWPLVTQVPEVHQYSQGVYHKEAKIHSKWYDFSIKFASGGNWVGRSYSTSAAAQSL